LDVGHGQLDYKLRNDSRVEVIEKQNARYPFDLAEAVDLVTIDVSFISLSLVIPAALSHLKEGCPLISLVKPQFEAGKEDVGRGGVVKDPQVHAQVLARAINWAVTHRLRLRNLCASPILGDAGNREFFSTFTRSSSLPPRMPQAASSMIGSWAAHEGGLVLWK
jgi:23S rRNA (cytidine1920-2'-O)/16S rRNA (cytidine1409-2'-O)-methyltransferase